MKVIVIGGTGIVGWDFVTTIVDRDFTVQYTYYRNEVEVGGAQGLCLDIRDENQVHEIVTGFDPDVVLHTAAMTDVDACEQYPERAREINVQGTKHVATACSMIDCPLVFYSSAFVFSGRKDRYNENADRDPINWYGKTKAAAERQIENTDGDSLIIRTDQPYTLPEPWQTDTMVSWTLERLEGGEPFGVFDDWYNCPIFIEDLTDVVIKLIADEKRGVYHVVGPDFISRYEWAKQIARVFDHSPSIVTSARAEDASLPAQRPNVNLDTTKVRHAIDTNIVNVETGLDQLA